MSADDPVDIKKIVEHSRAIFLSGLVTRGTALVALRQIEAALRSNGNYAEEELSPIAELINEIALEG
jgi:hypothetical protein